jgi:hypothetical protein
MSSTQRAIAVIVATVFAAAIFAPITRMCPNGPCATAPDADGYVQRYYEVKPIAGAWLETVSGKHLTLRYGSGVQKDKA